MSSSDPRAQAVMQEDDLEEFSLAPAIFLTFSSFPYGPSVSQSMDQPEKLKKIIENVTIQQKRVRGNMMFLVEQRAKRLASKAKETVEAAESDDEDAADNEKEKAKQKSIDACFAAMRVPAKKGARSEDFEYRAGNTTTMGTARGSDGENRDIEMSGTEETLRSPLNGDVNNELTQTQVLTALSKEMRDLVERGTAEMQAYDGHAKQVIAHYQQALDRRTGRKGSAQVSVASPVNNFAGGSPVDLHLQNFRRSSTGMPRVGSSGGGGQQPVRVPESIEELARRGRSDVKRVVPIFLEDYTADLSLHEERNIEEEIFSIVCLDEVSLHWTMGVEAHNCHRLRVPNIEARHLHVRTPHPSDKILKTGAGMSSFFADPGLCKAVGLAEHLVPSKVGTREIGYSSTLILSAKNSVTRYYPTQRWASHWTGPATLASLISIMRSLTAFLSKYCMKYLKSMSTTVADNRIDKFGAPGAGVGEAWWCLDEVTHG
ncbi:uncharacterized protein PAC_03619 [Phialocephala subalpina]|uniref:Uncharacterized protein n=1 Tax=Phialocephala subalpina TaxID=576137 RepID=A0A1L7WLU8_9HELO|nr:uncharacterized protein PAC_03619 [Phialocephala subalpina]